MCFLFFFFFFNDTATTEIYTLSLHDALPIWFSRDATRAGLRRIPLPIRLRATALQAESQSRQLGSRPAEQPVPRRKARQRDPFEETRLGVPFCPRIQHNRFNTALGSRRHSLAPRGASARRIDR